MSEIIALLSQMFFDCRLIFPVKAVLLFVKHRLFCERMQSEIKKKL